MKVGHVGSNANFGYLMNHGITPNGGGKKVNQYTIVYDIHHRWWQRLGLAEHGQSGRW